MNGIPKVTVNIGNGNLNQTEQTDDGVVGLVITGVTVSGASNASTGGLTRYLALVKPRTWDSQKIVPMILLGNKYGIFTVSPKQEPNYGLCW